MEFYVVFINGERGWIEPIEDDEDVQFIDSELVVDNGFHKYYYDLSDIKFYEIREIQEEL